MYVSTILFINISIASHHRPLLPFPSLPSETIVLIYDSICFLCVIVGWLGTLPLCSMWLCAGEDCPVLPHWRKGTWRKSKEKRECILRFSASKLYLLFFLLLTNTHLRWENHRFRIGTSSSQNDVLDACLSCCKHTHTNTPSRKWSHVIRMCEICSVFAQRTSCHLLRSGTRGFFFNLVEPHGAFRTRQKLRQKMISRAKWLCTAVDDVDDENDDGDDAGAWCNCSFVVQTNWCWHVEAKKKLWVST